MTHTFYRLHSATPWRFTWIKRQHNNIEMNDCVIATKLNIKIYILNYCWHILYKICSVCATWNVALHPSYVVYDFIFLHFILKFFFNLYILVIFRVKIFFETHSQFRKKVYEISIYQIFRSRNTHDPQPI